MADHTITLKNDTGRSGGSPVAGGGSRTGSSSALAAGSAKAAIAKSIVAVKGYIEPFVDRAYRYQINTVELRTGASEYQARLQEAYGVGKKLVDAATNIGTGAMMGGAWGAVAGAIYSGVTSAMDLGQRVKEIELSNSLERVSNRLANVRAGGMPTNATGSR